MKKTHDPEYRKFVDDTVMNRELEETIGRLKLSVFLAMLGPLTLAFARLTQMEGLPRGVLLALYATGPVALVLFSVNWVRAPQHARMNPKTWMHLLMTAGAMIATIILIPALGFTKP